ncbi:MAG: DUF1211 domain-containing protein [Thermoleophilaceae bacterium]|nr:DUF1211 domain-containing protein [Thermoleophilaceae bacterium]
MLRHGRPLRERKDGGLSDGVFAIAITLLVLDISVPARGFQDLWARIAGLVLLLAALAPRVAAFGFLAVSMAAIMLPARRGAVGR